MQNKLLTILFTLGLFLVSMGAAVAVPATTPGGIQLAKIQGEVTLRDNVTKATRSAVGVHDITMGTTVLTGAGGSVVLVFANGSTINLGRDSELDVETFLQDPFPTDIKVSDLTTEPSTSITKLNLAKGELVGNVKKLNTAAGSKFDVNTPVGAAGIRGTTFRIVYRPDPLNPTHVTFTVSTLEGNVLVQVASGSTSLPVSVTQNKEVTVDVQVNIDPVTKTVTIVSPPTVLTPVTLPTNTSSAILQATQDAVQATQTTLFPTTTTTPPATTTSKTTSGDG